MQVNFTGEITTKTEVTYSYIDSPKRGSTIFLPRDSGGNCYIEGKMIAGTLRHYNWHYIIEKQFERGIQYHLDTHQFNMCGGIKQAGAVDYQILRHRHYFENHPFVALWGCMEPAGIRGKIQVERAVPRTSTRTEWIRGTRSDIVQRGEIPERLLPAGNLDEYAAKLEDLRTDRNDRNARLAARKTKKKDDENAENINNDPIESRKMAANLPHSREAIARDVIFDHNICSTKDLTELQLGQLLVAFDRFSEDPHFGARARQNCGLVDIEYEVRIDRKFVGNLKIDGRKQEIVMDPNLEQYKNMFLQELPNLDFNIPVMA